VFFNSQKKQLSIRASLFATLLGTSALLCLPLLLNLNQSFRGDWDYFFSLYEVPSIALFEYGQFPLWNPYFCGGMPLIGNPQAGYLSPLVVFTSLFGVVAGLKIAVWIHTFLGMWGMWMLSGHLEIRGPARFAPPCVFMFTSAWALHLAEGHIVWLPAALIPFLLLAFLKGLDSRTWLVGAAVVESTMFYEGGTYVLGFTILFMLVYAAALSVESRSLQPLTAFATVNMLAALLSAPKLLPVLELLARTPRATDGGAGLSPYDLLRIFTDRTQSFATTFHGHGWWEYGAYLGILGVTLYLFSFSMYRSHKPLVWASLFMLLVSMGNFTGYAPWNILHDIPLFSFFKVPTRALLVFAFSAALLIGLSLEEIRREGGKYATAVVAVLVVLLSLDLFSVSCRIFAEAPKPSSMFYGKLQNKETAKAMRPYRVSLSGTSSIWSAAASLRNSFSQTSVPLDRRNAHGGWSDQYRHILQNRGVVDAYETIPVRNNARAVTDTNYQGEAYFLGKGAVTSLGWSPNRLAFKVTAHEAGRLVVNQNYWDGWRATNGMPRPYNGLLSIELGKGDHIVSLYYLPGSFLAGAGVLVGTLSLIIITYRVKALRLRRALPAYGKTTQ